MTIISSKEFATHQEKYFELALNEHVFVQRGNNMFIVTTANDDDYDDEDIADLALAMSRRNDEMTSSKDFRNFLKSLP